MDARSQETDPPSRQAVLAQLGTDPFLTDGGIETTLVYLEGVPLPHFAAFTLLDDDGDGLACLRDYYRSYGQLSRSIGMGIVLDTPTYRANPEWGALLGYDAAALTRVDRRAVALLRDIRSTYQGAANPIVISGCVGPRGRSYHADDQMTALDAAAYHSPQVHTLTSAGADVITAHTLSYAAEGIGVVLAAQRVGVPVAIGFTLGSDGLLPDGSSLGAAITAVDAATDAAAAYFIVSCSHPAHFASLLLGGEPWVERIRGVRANASTADHAERDELTSLDSGDPADLADRLAALRTRLPQLTVVGGCCGTDERHIEQIGLAVRAATASLG